jgi:hypothetical protein
VTDKITLQVNTSGAWKNVTDFDADRRAAVMAAVDTLAFAIGTHARWCFMHADGKREGLRAG